MSPHLTFLNYCPCQTQHTDLCCVCLERVVGGKNQGNKLNLSSFMR